MFSMTNDPPRGILTRIFYRSVQWITLVLLKVLFRYQYRYADRLPMSGGTLICPNHTSHLDPMAVGCMVRRRVAFLAKKSLFEIKLLGAFLNGVDCIPIDRKATGIGGMKETLKRLKRSESIVFFPEGERSRDGNMLPLMTGFTALVKRVKVQVVPIGIHGTHDAWPRGQSTPKLGRIKLIVGHPIPFDDLKDMSEEEMADYVGQKIAECYDEARQWNTEN